MNPVATTNLSTKGQVVIPESIREQLSLEPGTQFVVVAEGDAILLRALRAPDMSEFNTLVRKSRAAARGAGLRKSDVRKAIRKARSRR